MKISLESLLQRLARKGNDRARTVPADTDNRAPTSIRLKPATKHFIDCQATALGISAQSVIGIILDGVAESSVDTAAGTLRTIKERFFYLFEMHRLDLPSIVSIMKGHGFTLSALDDSGRLLDLLDQKAIQYLARTFAVRPEWISGASDSVIELSCDVRWYKNVYATGRRLLEYAAQGLRPHVMFLRRERANFAAAVADNDRGNATMEPIGMVVRLSRTTDDGVSFTTYEVGEFERWNYWRCREQYKLLIAFCDQANRLISYSGYEMPDEDLELLRASKVLPVVVLNRIRQVGWHPDDYASLRDKVTEEAEDWQSIRKQYESGRYDSLIKEALPASFEE